MQVKKNDRSPKKRSRDNFPISYQIIAIFVVITVALLFFIWHQKNKATVVNSEIKQERLFTEEISIPEQTVIPENEANDASFPAIEEVKSQTEDHATTHSVETQSPEETGTPDDPLSSADNSVVIESQKNTFTESVPTNQYNPIAERCAESAQPIRQFYKHLDQQDYLRQYDLSPESEVYFNRVIQGLLDNPPVVSGETNDLYTILQNTAHFFRIVGKTNILILKAILDREKEQFEGVLEHFYTMLLLPSCFEQHFDLQVSESSLYEYAGFFLSTMGGRLYLFRRDSMSRMVVSYYAILLIDRANKNGTNKHGIEIAWAIDQLINEIESTANTLQLKETYLDTLYTLKEEYQFAQQ